MLRISTKLVYDYDKVQGTTLLCKEYLDTRPYSNITNILFIAENKQF